MNRAVFLDRDGTIIVHKPYLADPDQVELVSGGPEALRRLQEVGFKLIVVTNQSVIGRGWATRAQVEATNRRIDDLYAEHGVTFDAHYYCPHAPDDPCDCRKPKPGLLLQAAREHDLDLDNSYMIGDNPTDIEAGQNAGLKQNLFLIGDSHLYSEAPGVQILEAPNTTVVNGIEQATERIMRNAG